MHRAENGSSTPSIHKQFRRSASFRQSSDGGLTMFEIPTERRIVEDFVNVPKNDLFSDRLVTIDDDVRQIPQRLDLMLSRRSEGTSSTSRVQELIKGDRIRVRDSLTNSKWRLAFGNIETWNSALCGETRRWKDLGKAYRPHLEGRCGPKTTKEQRSRLHLVFG